MWLSRAQRQPFASTRLLGRNIGATAPQNIFLNLSGGGLGQFGQKSETLRDFEMRQMLPRKLPQLRVSRGCA